MRLLPGMEGVFYLRVPGKQVYWIVAENGRFESMKQKKEREKEIWEIYDKIQKGADFSELARRYSEDQSSSEKGGLLPLLTTGQIIPSFEKAAFALNEIGEVSKPVRTEFGWHII